MGNRLEEGLCVRCGTPLIDLKQFACSQCLPIIAAQVKKVQANVKSEPGMYKRLSLPTKPGQSIKK